jgi:hypothetical protein
MESPLLVIYETWDPQWLATILNPSREVACWAKKLNPGLSSAETSQLGWTRQILKITCVLVTVLLLHALLFALLQMWWLRFYANKGGLGACSLARVCACVRVRALYIYIYSG